MTYKQKLWQFCHLNGYTLTNKSVNLSLQLNCEFYIKDDIIVTDYDVDKNTSFEYLEAVSFNYIKDNKRVSEELVSIEMLTEQKFIEEVINRLKSKKI